jgi:hypothetical protein
MAIERVHIPFEDVESSTLSGMGYDPERGIIAIKFRNGRIWHYAGATRDLVSDFYTAGSKGQFYNAYIKGKLTGEPMTGDCPKCGDHGWSGDKCEDCGCAEYAIPERPLRHFVMADEPSATSKRLQRTVCGEWVPAKDVAKQEPYVTCDKCKAEIARFDAMSF